jgi:ABC-type nitrate/sulfonate/bicarbonate transport system permease component
MTMRQRFLTFARAALVQLWLPVVLIAVWWIASSSSTSFYFPPLSAILADLWQGLTGGDLLSATGYSLRNLLLGLLVALVAGVAIGVLLGLNKAVEAATRPMLDYARAVPHVAFVPVIIVALGLGWLPKVLLIALGCVWPILLNTVDGVRGISPQVLECTRAYRIPLRLVVRRVVLPACAPQAFAGLRVALQVGMVMLIVSEMYGSTTGIGFFVLQSGENYAVTDTWAGTVLIGGLGYLLSLVLLAAEQLSLGWYFQRQPARRRGAVRVPNTERAVAS